MKKIPIIMFLISIVCITKKFYDRMIAAERTNIKNDRILKVYCEWFKIRQKGKSVAKYLRDNNYMNVAIYGLHYLGENLFEELRAEGINVKYCIDQNKVGIYNDIRIISPDDPLEEVDAVIVTAFVYIDDIKRILQGRVNSPILSLEDLMFIL